MVGSRKGVIASKATREKLYIPKGDTLYVTDGPDGSLHITPYNSEFARQMTLAEQIMREDREILRALAKCPRGGGSQQTRCTRSTTPSLHSTAAWTACATATCSNPLSRSQHHASYGTPPPTALASFPIMV
jgi:hypothetical protein